MNTIDHFIGGHAYSAESRESGAVFDPATGEQTATVPFASSRVVETAVANARNAWQQWREVPLSKRAQIMFAYRELLNRHRDDIARLITSEHGKVFSDAQGEVARGLEVVEFACGIPHLVKGEFSDNVSSSVDSYSIRQPLGVVAGISPFNFPAMVPMWMFPVAVACGNAFVLKPSEKDPSTSVMLAELFLRAGLPPGVFNVVHGDKIAVDALLEHPDVAAVSSVGSTPVARYIYETAARHGKRVQALGGAKNHMVVLPDCDIDAAADAAVGAAYGSTGQRCMAVSAVVAVGDAGDALVGALSRRLEELEVGPGTSDSAEMGPLVTGEARDKVLGYIETGLNEGAELVVDGRDLKVEGHENGFFVGPCLFDQVTGEMTVYRDEIFGPVLVVVRADNYDAALDIVNSSPYGNGVAIFTNDGSAARRFQREVEVGMVGINVPIPVPMAFYSFGGWKSSLFGDAHVHGMEGVRFYTRAKAITARWPDEVRRGVSLGFPQT